MNWEVFWTMMVGVPIVVALLLACIYGLVKLDERMHWRLPWGFAAFMALLFLAMATMAGMAPT